MRRHGSPQELERIRLKAVELHQQGMAMDDIAESLDRCLRWVQGALKQFRERGESGLRHKPHVGRQPKLSTNQRQQLLTRILKGGRANGFDTDLWTAPRVRELIQRVFRVNYHVHHVPKLLQQLGLSCRKPERRARQQDEAAIASWTRCDWRRVKKTPVR